MWINDMCHKSKQNKTSSMVILLPFSFFNIAQSLMLEGKKSIMRQSKRSEFTQDDCWQNIHTMITY